MPEAILEYDHQYQSPRNTVDIASELARQLGEMSLQSDMLLKHQSSPAALCDISNDSAPFWFLDWDHKESLDVRLLADSDTDSSASSDPGDLTSNFSTAAARSERYRCGSRPYLRSRFSWALVRHAVHPAFLVQRWADWAHAGVALHFRHSIPQGVWTSLTRLKLQLDDTRPGDEHGHTLYTVHHDHARYPNWWTMCEVVGLCAYLGDRLVGLSISMCFPELVVPHVPRFVHHLVQRCPSLLYLGIEDTQCECFSSYLFPNFGYLADAVLADRPTVGESIVTREGRLHTLALSKRSIVPWEEEYHEEGMADIFQEIVQDAEYPPYHVEHKTAISHIGMKTEEARDLARLMMHELPSLWRAYVSLDRGALDLRADRDGRFRILEAGEAYLGEC